MWKLHEFTSSKMSYKTVPSGLLESMAPLPGMRTWWPKSISVFINWCMISRAKVDHFTSDILAEYFSQVTELRSGLLGIYGIKIGWIPGWRLKLTQINIESGINKPLLVRLFQSLSFSEYFIFFKFKIFDKYIC